MLIIIQFVVINKGSERVAEVTARFTLDAMPGKQMAIDADLNTGASTDKEAKARRDKIQKESSITSNRKDGIGMIKNKIAHNRYNPTPKSVFFNIFYSSFPLNHGLHI